MSCDAMWSDSLYKCLLTCVRRQQYLSSQGPWCQLLHSQCFEEQGSKLCWAEFGTCMQQLRCNKTEIEKKVRVYVREKDWTQGKTARERLSAALTFPTAVPIWSLFCTPLSAGRTQGMVMLSPTPFFHQKLWFPIRFLLMGTDGDRRGGEEGRERHKPETMSVGKESRWVGIKWKVFKSRTNREKKSNKRWQK